MSERGISRRQFLKFGGGLAALFALRGVVGLEHDTLTIEHQAKLQRNSGELLINYPFLTPYASFLGEISTSGRGVTTMVAVHPRPAPYNLAGIRICDGAAPGLSISNSMGMSVAYNGEYNFEHASESSSLIGNAPISELTVPLIQGPPVIYQNRPITSIVVAGDSWTRWGGVEHSYATMLQRLFSYSGLGVAVHDISVSGVNIANHLLVLEKLKNGGYAPDLIITTLHNTDLVQDTQRILSPVGYQKALMKIDSVYQTAADFNARTAAIKRFAGEVERYFPVLRDLRSRFRNRKGGDMRALTNQEGMITDAGYLASLTDTGRPYFEIYTYLMSEFIGHNQSSDHIIMVLPDGLTDSSYEIFESQVVGPVEAVAANQTDRFASVHTHDYPADEFDAFGHPTQRGSYFLAEKTFEKITGSKPDDKVANLAWNHTGKVTEYVKVFRNNL